MSSVFLNYFPLTVKLFEYKGPASVVSERIAAGGYEMAYKFSRTTAASAAKTYGKMPDWLTSKA